MSLYSSLYPAGAQFDPEAPWQDDYVDPSHEIEAEIDEAEEESL